jgi:hypothetical protein
VEREHGPVASPEDSWGTSLDDPLDTSRARPIAVHRRAPRRPGPAVRWAIIITAALVAIIATIQLIADPSPSSDEASPTPSSNLTSQTDPSIDPSGERGGWSATPGPTDTGAAGAGPTASSAPPAPVVADIAAEAETGVLSGQAAVVADPQASGGFLVGGLGNGGGLEITGLRITTGGTYRLTLYLTNGASGQPRRAVVTVAGTAHTINYSGSASCCGTRSVTVDLAPGPLVVSIANPDGVAPMVDRIVLAFEQS